MLPQASSHQIHDAFLVANKKRLLQGVQKCGRTLASRDQKRGVRERFFYFIYFMHMNAVWQSLCVRYWKSLRATNIHRKFCTPGLVTRFWKNALFVISLFGWHTALDVPVRRLVHASSAHPW